MYGLVAESLPTPDISVGPGLLSDFFISVDTILEDSVDSSLEYDQAEELQQLFEALKEDKQLSEAHRIQVVVSDVACATVALEIEVDDNM